MYGHKQKDPIDEQNDRIIAEWLIPISIAFITTIFVLYATGNL